MNNRLAGKIGELSTADVTPTVYELNLSDFLTFIDPKNYGLDIVGIDPVKYFVTSGDAVQKAIVLDKDLWKHAGAMRKLVCETIIEENNCAANETNKLLKNGTTLIKYPKLIEYESLIWKSAGQARKLLQALKLARGQNVFLETEWNDDRTLYCLCKNPRMK